MIAVVAVVGGGVERSPPPLPLPKLPLSFAATTAAARASAFAPSASVRPQTTPRRAESCCSLTNASSQIEAGAQSASVNATSDAPAAAAASSPVLRAAAGPVLAVWRSRRCGSCVEKSRAVFFVLFR